ncbi:aspartate aminotransferase family protein [Halalkalibacterium ligniniphilum]|uniref:aspartate aminotransferase family protein n=1 Tax=Halalkalibacterium ligniniphilum TaxID=1134413 RepID=UPI000348E2D2|nr:aspartate aminotransferase family protein [Halalkalibacterium ligniniphilum]
MGGSHLIKPLLDGIYPTVSYGKGVFLYDTDGKAYFDASSGAVTASIGHGVKEVIEAMNRQANKVSFVYRSQFTNEPAEQLAERLASLLPGALNHCFFVNSGSEATETALKIAIQYWQEKGRPMKTRILSRWMSYHGITLGALSMSGHHERRKRFEPLLNSCPQMEPPYQYRLSNKSVAEELERLISRIGPEHIAAFIAEPIVGAAGGALVPEPSYYKEMKQVLDKYDILFIADEVMTGIGRTGSMLALEHWGVIPQIVALGKGLSAGYAPLAATIVSDDIIEPIKAGSKLIMSGHTFSANPQACAAGLAVLNYMEKNDLFTRSKILGEELIQRLVAIQLNSSIIGEVRGKGLLIGIEFVKDKKAKIPFPKAVKLTERLIMLARQEGVLLYPASAGIEGGDGDAILIAPPFTMSNQELNDLLQRLEVVFATLEKQLIGGV